MPVRRSGGRAVRVPSERAGDAGELERRERAYCRWLGEGARGAGAPAPRDRVGRYSPVSPGCPGSGPPAGDAARIPDSEAFCDAMIAAADREIIRPGLLWEWTEDWYERYPGGAGHRDFGTVYRVLRGGSGTQRAGTEDPRVQAQEMPDRAEPLLRVPRSPDAVIPFPIVIPETKKIHCHPAFCVYI